MEKYKIEVTEYLQRVIDVEADSEEEAIKFINDQYKNKKIVLDADDYIQTDIEVYDPNRLTDKLSVLLDRIDKFNKDRDWDQFHSPANLAKSICIEAGELLECFQWSDDYNFDDVKEELADVMNYCLQMSQVLGINIIDTTNEKMDETEKKYPVEKAKGNAKKYTKFK